ncbi:aminotransferase class V-fold PLP-dependent enzyme, partial [Archangium sp.]|uniref:aminotransferase class V-fold PLP-dependent enzyme n=1 Tax=Archangium sp. TaxID=1872627 RepID=UPI002D53C4B5
MDTSPFRSHWSLDPEVTFLNHGSFGACPTRVLEEQSRLRARMEAQPLRFLHRELEAQADTARAALGAFLDADPDDLAFVNNATTGVNTVLQSLRFAPGDELLTTDHE